MNPTIRAAVAAVALFAVSAERPAIAHEGHDHDAPAAPVAAASLPRAEASSDLFELVAIAKGGDLVVYVDRFLTNEPVLGAAVEVETPDGPRAAAQTADAYRLAAPWLQKPGRHELLITVSAGDAVDILTATLVVPAPTVPPVDAAARGFLAAVAADLKQRAKERLVADPLAGVPTLFVGGAAGFVAGAVVTLLLRRRGGVAAAALLAAVVVPVLAASAHEGHDHGEPPPTPLGQAVPQRLADGALFVPKPTQRILAIRTQMTEMATHATAVELPGRIIPDPNASGFVQASAGGRLSPPSGGFPRLGATVAAGDVLAYVMPPLTAAEISDQRQRQGELDQQIALVERRIARFESLDRTRVIARAQLEDARVELAGLRDRRAALDRLRRDPEPLVAPVSGRVAAANAVAGQVVEPSAVVFHIVDPRRLWVEALSFAPLSASPRAASARDADGRSLSLRYEGSGLADRSQAVPMHLSIQDDTTGLRLGQLVAVQVETRDSRDGIVLPRTSVLRGASGQAIAFEHVAAERFEPREVRVVPLDAERVLVAAGLERGRRVVTQGAELLNQIR